MNPFELAGVAGGLMVLSLSPFVLLGLAIPYAILKLKDARGIEHDPQIGLKAVLHFVWSLCILLFLTGLTTLVIDLITEKASPPPTPFGRVAVIQPSSGFNDTRRTATALM